MLVFQAGDASDQTGNRIPIAQADLLVDVGRGPYITNAAPYPFVCAPGQSTNLTVQAGDLDTAQPDTTQVRVLFGSREIDLSPGGGNTFVGTLESFCQEILTDLVCDVRSETTFVIRLVAVLNDGTVGVPSELTLPVQASGLACTPTPTPTPVPPTPTPTPTATPIPDSDGDGYNDLQDKCVDRANWPMIRDFDGCPPPLWLTVLSILAALALLVFIVWFLIPWLLVRTVLPPPGGYVLICEDGRPGNPRSIRDAGIRARRRKVTIGSKGHIQVKGLKDIELRIERHGKEFTVHQGAKGPSQFVIRQIPTPRDYEYESGERKVKVKLVFGTDKSQLNC
jgi:hypothetical protein